MVIIFKSQKLPAMMLAWENLWEVFVLLLFIFDVVYLFPGYFAMSPALHPAFSDPWRSPLALSYTPATIDCLFFFERYGFEWAFLTYRRLLPNAPSQHFWHIPDIFAFIKFLVGADGYFLESCRTSYWSSKHRLGPFVLFDSQ